MGSPFHPKTPRKRSWRRSIGLAAFSPGQEPNDRVGALDPSTRRPVGFGPENSTEPPLATTVREPWALKTTDTLRPGERGTKRLAAEFGDRLVCVRYRCDPQNRKRYKTVELIVAETDWDPPPEPGDAVHVRIAYAEEDLRERVKAAGGRWRPDTKTWELPFGLVEDLGLKDRMVDPGGSQM